MSRPYERTYAPPRPQRIADIRPYHPRPPTHPFGPCTEVASVAIDDDLPHVVASPEPGVWYGLEISGWEGLRISVDGKIHPGDPVCNATEVPIWFTVASHSALLVVKRAVNRGCPVSVRLLRRGR